jgi:hypothetical protein
VALESPIHDLEVMRREVLRRDVVLVDPPLRFARVEGAASLTRREPLQLWDPDLDHKTAAGLEVGRHVAEARYLSSLRRQIHDRVEDQIGEGKRSVDGRGGEVADRYPNLFGAWLGSEPREHRPGQVDAVYRHPQPRERQRDAPGADAKLERAPASSDPCQEVDGAFHRCRLDRIR